MPFHHARFESRLFPQGNLQHDTADNGVRCYRCICSLLVRKFVYCISFIFPRFELLYVTHTSQKIENFQYGYKNIFSGFSYWLVRQQKLLQSGENVLLLAVKNKFPLMKYVHTIISSNLDSFCFGLGFLVNNRTKMPKADLISIGYCCILLH